MLKQVGAFSTIQPPTHLGIAIASLKQVLMAGQRFNPRADRRWHVPRTFQGGHRPPQRVGALGIPGFFQNNPQNGSGWSGLIG